jgi:hypothetical protein
MGFFIILTLVTLPGTACADCVLTDSPYKFEVVCSGTDDKPQPPDIHKKSKNSKRSSTRKRATFDERVSGEAPVEMSKEEILMMHANNTRDGSRVKRPKELHAKQ